MCDRSQQQVPSTRPPFFSHIPFVAHNTSLTPAFRTVVACAKGWGCWLGRMEGQVLSPIGVWKVKNSSSCRYFLAHDTSHCHLSVCCFLAILTGRPSSQASGAAWKAVVWDACVVMHGAAADGILSGSRVWRLAAPSSGMQKHDGQGDRLCVVLSGAASSGPPSVCVLSDSFADDSSSMLPRGRSSSDPILPAASLNMTEIAQLFSAADKNITRISCSSFIDGDDALIIASSTDGSIRAFTLTPSSAHSGPPSALPYRLSLVWRIAAVKSEVNEWITRPLPHMAGIERMSAVQDAAEGNSSNASEWLQPIEESSPKPTPQSNSSSVGSKFRAAVRNVSAVAAMAHSREMWLLGGASSASATTRWYNLPLSTIDIKRVAERDANALSHALDASDILPMLDNDRSRSNPQGVEVLSCSVALAHGSCVFAGYVDGTFRVWKRVSALAPPSALCQWMASAIHGDKQPFRTVAAAHEFQCFRTFKLSDASIADAVMTRDGNCVVVCDALGMQFSVSVCRFPQTQSLRSGGAVHAFGQTQIPFAFTTEPSVQVCTGISILCLLQKYIGFFICPISFSGLPQTFSSASLQMHVEELIKCDPPPRIPLHSELDQNSLSRRM